MELQLKIIGYILVLLSLVHAVFPKRFDWKTELGSLSLINKELMYVHTFFIALMVFLNGLLCLFCTEDLIFTRLGKHVCIGLFVFWAFRLAFQFFGYSSALWKGKPFETAVHIVFAIFWSYLTLVFLMIGLS